MKLFGKVFVVLILLLSGLKIAFAQKSFGELWKEYSGDQKSIPPPSTQGDNISKLKALRDLLRERLLEKEDEGSKIEVHKYFEEDISQFFHRLSFNLTNSIKGLNNLKLTYISDISIKTRLDLIISKIQKHTEEIESILKIKLD